MSLSLRDQLLQAGLISEKQAKQAAKNQGSQRREQARNPAAAAAAEARRRAEADAAAASARARADRDAELNRRQQDKTEARARRAQVKQLVDQHRLPKVEGDAFYNFVDGAKIRRIPVTPAMREQLGRGELAIVRSDGRYEVVPAAIADRVAERDAQAVISRGGGSAPAVDADDPYKDYVVPDDLMW